MYCSKVKGIRQWEKNHALNVLVTVVNEEVLVFVLGKRGMRFIKKPKERL